MNERIQKLVKQAGGEFWQRLENDAVNPEAYITFDPPESLEKFAELIVRECMWKIMVRKDEAIDNGWRVDEAMSMSLSDISEHFGVQE